MSKNKIFAKFIIAFFLLIGISDVPYSEKKTKLEKAIEVLENEVNLEDPKEIMAWVSVPRLAKIGDIISVKFSIENAREKKKFKLSGMDILDEFLVGFEILEISPEPRNKDHSFGYLALEYPNDLKAGDVFEIVIKLKAEKAGVFIGDIDINEGDKYLTRVFQTRVE